MLEKLFFINCISIDNVNCRACFKNKQLKKLNLYVKTVNKTSKNIVNISIY